MSGDAPRGFVTKAEYLKLRARCEELEEIVAYHESEAAEPSTALVEAVRLKAKVSPQGAHILIALARWKRSPLMDGDSLCARADVKTRSHLNTLVSIANRRIRELGGPQFTIKGYQGRWSNGRCLTPEGISWLKSKVPELFAKGRSR